MYIKESVHRPSAKNAGTGIKNREELVLLDVDDILYFPPRDDKGVVILENIVMKPGRYGISIYMTPGTTEVSSAADGETDQVGFTPSVKFTHPGNEQQVREFKANCINGRYIGILRYCDGKPADLFGAPCTPCKITPSYTGNKDSNTNEFTLEQITKGDDIAIYRGTVPLEEPVAAIAASATEVEFVSSGQYQASEGDATITKVTGGSANALVTILGCAGTAPTVANGNGENANILLRNGRNFVAAEGAQLTLRAFPTADNKLLWIEQSRYEAN